MSSIAKLPPKLVTAAAKGGAKTATVPPPNQLLDDCDFAKLHGFGAWLQLVRAYNFMEARISADLRDDDLTLSQMDVLVTLCMKGAINQQGLADLLFVTKGNVVGLIDRLSARGLVERQNSETDRRVNLLHITAEGRRLVDRALPRQRQLISHLMDPLTKPEAETLEKLLARLKA
jgi:MarR family transcriptional regulator, organic hydroperoxide resistance regulator